MATFDKKVLNDFQFSSNYANHCFSVLIDHQAEVERLKEAHRLSLIEVGAEQVKARPFVTNQIFTFLLNERGYSGKTLVEDFITLLNFFKWSQKETF